MFFVEIFLEFFIGFEFFTEIFLKFFIGFVFFIEIFKEIRSKFSGSSNKILVRRVATFDDEFFGQGKICHELLLCSIEIG